MRNDGRAKRTIGRGNGRPPRLGDLPPRVRPVLALLLRGLSEKQAAERLGLSRHTVHQYVKMLYKLLGVNSRARLMALWLQVGERLPRAPGVRPKSGHRNKRSDKRSTRDVPL